MAKLVITIDLDNDATSPVEIGEVLRKFIKGSADSFDNEWPNEGYTIRLKDANGNAIGSAVYTS